MADRDTQQRHERMMTPIEVTFARAMQREKNRAIREMARGYQVLITLPNSMIEKHIQNTQDIIARYGRKAITLFSNDLLITTGQKSMEIKQIDAELLIDQLVAQWIAENAFAQAREIATTTVEDMRRAVREGLDEGLGSDQIAAGIVTGKLTGQ
jgi:hypothetical protein